jgi:hypothetical protein
MNVSCALRLRNAHVLIACKQSHLLTTGTARRPLLTVVRRSELWTGILCQQINQPGRLPAF